MVRTGDKKHCRQCFQLVVKRGAWAEERPTPCRRHCAGRAACPGMRSDGAAGTFILLKEPPCAAVVSCGFLAKTSDLGNLRDEGFLGRAGRALRTSLRPLAVWTAQAEGAF